MATSDIWRVLLTGICLLFIGKVTSWLQSPDRFYDAVSVNDVDVVNKDKSNFTCANTHICKRVWPFMQLQSLSLCHTRSHCFTNGTTFAKMNATKVVWLDLSFVWLNLMQRCTMYTRYIQKNNRFWSVCMCIRVGTIWHIARSLVNDFNLCVHFDFSLLLSTFIPLI